MTGHLSIADVNGRVPIWLVAVTGLVAFTVVAGMWILTRAGVTIAHEGSHALTASAVGGKVHDINIFRLGGGLTNFTVDGNDSTFLVFLAGYIGPPLFGVCGAMLLSTGRVRATLWLSFFLLVCALFMAKGWYSIGTILATGAVIFVVIRYAGDGTQTFFAYTWIWYLLIGGIRAVLKLAELRSVGPDESSDAFKLHELTVIPAAIWVGFFGLAAFAALVAGGLIMVGALGGTSTS